MSITTKDIYQLDRRGERAAKGDGKEILLGTWFPIDDKKLIFQGIQMMRKLMNAYMVQIGAHEGSWVGKVGINRKFLVDGMPTMYWRVYIKKGCYDESKVMTLEQQKEEANAD